MSLKTGNEWPSPTLKPKQQNDAGGHHWMIVPVNQVVSNLNNVN